MAEKYIVIELQKTGNAMSHIVTTHDTLADAQYKFYSVAALAAISTVERHSIILLSDDGFMIDKVVFEHPVE